MSIKLEILDNNNNNDIIQYEQGLYKANEKSIHGNSALLERIYFIDKQAKRLIPRVEYDKSTHIFSIKQDENIIAAVVGRTNMKKPLFYNLGFSGDYDDGKSSEGLGLYSNVTYIDGLGFPAEQLFKFAENSMMKSGIMNTYGTAYGERLLKGYKNMGFCEVDSIEFNNKNLYLIRYDFNQKV